MRARLIASIMVSALLAGCVGTVDPVEEEIDDPEVVTIAAATITSTQKHLAEQLTSIFENDTPVLDYEYAKDIGDGNGYTSGRAGFCTGTGDALLVAKCYQTAVSSNRLSKYIPELTRLADAYAASGIPQADTSGLDKIGSYAADWTYAAHVSATFRACQDTIVTQLYWTPALQQVQLWGLTTALTKAVFYDTAIQHGERGMRSIIRKTNSYFGIATGTKVTATTTEATWLSRFLTIRRSIISSNGPVWYESRGRVDEYRDIVAHGNWSLVGPITTLRTVSGYTVYTIW